MLHALVVDVAPDPLALAARLAGRSGSSLLLDVTGGTSYLAAEPVETSSSLDPEPDLAVSAATRDLARAPRWIGVLPYEARRELERNPEPDRREPPHVAAPRWLRYRAVVEVGERVRVIGDDPGAVGSLARALRGKPQPLEPARLEPARPDEPDALHRQRVVTALEHIVRGDVYVVNIARRFRFACAGHPVQLLAHLGRRARAPFGIALHWDGLGVAGQSPELFLRTHADGRVETWPIKGTRPRGSDAAEDAALRRELAEDPKEAAELAMVVDVERNDLGRVAVTGSVRVTTLGEVVTHPSVHHRVARVVGRVREGTSREALLRALLPSGSVTGAPKVRAMEVIRDLEPQRRGLYTGAFGLLRHDGTLELAMAIRTLTVVGGEGCYFAGGGIVADSDPARETEETRWKALAVLDG